MARRSKPGQIVVPPGQHRDQRRAIYAFDYADRWGKVYRVTVRINLEEIHHTVNRALLDPKGETTVGHEAFIVRAKEKKPKRQEESDVGQPDAEQ